MGGVVGSTVGNKRIVRCVIDGLKYLALRGECSGGGTSSRRGVGIGGSSDLDAVGTSGGGRRGGCTNERRRSERSFCSQVADQVGDSRFGNAGEVGGNHVN